MEKENLSPPSAVSSMIEEDLDWVREISLQVAEFDVGTETPSFYSREALERMVASQDCV